MPIMSTVLKLIRSSGMKTFRTLHSTTHCTDKGRTNGDTRTHTHKDRFPATISWTHTQKVMSLRDLCLQANYTDRAIALVGEVGAKFCGYRMPCDQRDRSLRPYCRFSRLEPLLFLPSSSSIVLRRLSGPRSRPNTSQKI
jgi:hypothetical protein